MTKKSILIFIFILISNFVSAQVKVAFIKVYRPNGSVLYLEPNFAYAHVAISYERGWINAHPKHGVQLTKSLEELDFPKHESFIMQSYSMPEISTEKALRLQGRNYDREFNWDSDDSLYCSELVAKLLAVRPKPMFFDPKIWPKPYWKLNGRPGISPFLLLQEMLDLGFLPASRSSF